MQEGVQLLRQPDPPEAGLPRRPPRRRRPLHVQSLQGGHAGYYTGFNGSFMQRLIQHFLRAIYLCDIHQIHTVQPSFLGDSVHGRLLCLRGIPDGRQLGRERPHTVH